MTASRHIPFRDVLLHMLYDMCTIINNSAPHASDSCEPSGANHILEIT